MSNPIAIRIAQKINTLESTSLFRKLNKQVPHDLINCAANSYLNLESIEELHQKSQRLHSFSNGNGASRLVQEVSPLFAQLERQIAQWKHTEKALFFNSGYIANLSIIQALATPKTTIFSDRLNHASIVDGIKLSGARLRRYNHCDTTDLERVLQADDNNEKMVITDTVFSMDGTVAPLAEIVALCKKYNAFLMVDEAHATGLFGASGGGIVEEMGLESVVDLRMGTLSKAVGGVGGFVACSAVFYNYFVNTCRGLIYSTALPPSALAWNSVAIEHITSSPQEGGELLAKAAKLRRKLLQAHIDIAQSTTHIIPLITGSSERALALSLFLETKGYRAPAIRPPTVPNGASRVRISLHSGISQAQIDTLADTIIAWFHD